MKLKRTKQCAKCPWKKSVSPHDIPDGYDVEKHKALQDTIAKPGELNLSTLKIMACHETGDAHCIGWLLNQLGPGNNIGLRFAMRDCENLKKAKTVGPQHECFEDTLPVES